MIERVVSKSCLAMELIEIHLLTRSIAKTDHR